MRQMLCNYVTAGLLLHTHRSSQSHPFVSAERKKETMLHMRHNAGQLVRAQPVQRDCHNIRRMGPPPVALAAFACEITQAGGRLPTYAHISLLPSSRVSNITRLHSPHAGSGTSAEFSGHCPGKQIEQFRTVLPVAARLLNYCTFDLLSN